MSEYGPDLAYIHHAGFSEFAESAAPGLLEILWKHGVYDGLVVDLGCGTGVLARELTRAGFDVLGVDASPAMVALAQEHCGAGAPPAVSPAPGRDTAEAAVERPAGRRHHKFIVGKFGEVELPRCKAIVAMGEVLNYGTFDAVRALVARANTNLLVFDVAERGAYPPYDERRVEGEDWSVVVVKQGDGTHLTRRILTFRAEGETMRRTEEVHRLELYDRAAMKALLREHGFRVRVRRSYGTRRLPKGHAVYTCVRR
ncbi:MAG TPA: class I SAM-dependent methyltransferase [Thermoanaerobaculia bacterium]|nr:class I SAM-dependent methyltransferase [Thermoanaerobaculia bacterium]